MCTFYFMTKRTLLLMKRASNIYLHYYNMYFYYTVVFPSGIGYIVQIIIVIIDIGILHIYMRDIDRIFATEPTTSSRSYIF